MTTKLRRDAELNRVRILDAARAGFAERGLGITLDEIARLAGVGVGTVYRRFPNKELLIDVLFEERFEEVVANAAQAAAEQDPWLGLQRFLEGSVNLLVADRGLRELVLGSQHTSQRLDQVRDRIKPYADDLVTRAQAEGTLRSDVSSTDMPLMLMMLDSLFDHTRAVSPDVWRRALQIILDGLRGSRDRPSPLPEAALTEQQVDATLAAWRP